MRTTRLQKDQFPRLLREIRPLPDHLDCAGSLPPSEDEYKYLCVVGSRKCSDYGQMASRKLIGGLRGYPVVIVSGLAIGIDSLAHEIALDAGLKVIAFPGSGLAEHSIYPPSRLYLARRIIESGNTLLSPFDRNDCGTHWSFPVRNRLMAGISHATLVIEGGRGSGTLLTAGNAAEFGRDVLVVPGSISDELSYGPHCLMRQGATPVTSSEDILEALGIELVDPSRGRPMERIDRSRLSPEEDRVMSLLRSGPRDAGDLIRVTGLPPSSLNIVMSRLELLGYVTGTGETYRLA